MIDGHVFVGKTGNKILCARTDWERERSVDHANSSQLVRSVHPPTKSSPVAMHVPNRWWWLGRLFTAAIISPQCQSQVLFVLLGARITSSCPRHSIYRSLSDCANDRPTNIHTWKNPFPIDLGIFFLISHSVRETHRSTRTVRHAQRGWLEIIYRGQLVHSFDMSRTWVMDGWIQTSIDRFW